MKISIEMSNPHAANESVSVEVKRDDLTFDEFIGAVLIAAELSGYGRATVDECRNRLKSDE